MSIYSIFKGCKDINILKTLIFPEVQPEGTASLIKGHKVCRQTEKLIWPFKVKWELFDRRFLSVLIRKCNLIWRKTLATVTVLKSILHASAQISKKCGGGTKLSLSCLWKVHNDAVHENTDTCVILWGRVVGMIMKTTKNLTLLLVEMQQYPEHCDD